MKYFVTGGAGFIGSHAVDALLKEGNQVVVFDNFSRGRTLFIQHNLTNKRFGLIKGDLSNTKLLQKGMKGADVVMHFAAHADVRDGFRDHDIDHAQNLEMTRNVLEAMVKNGVKRIGFTSTSSVYGDATVLPTPETYPLNPTSLYGATKAACEHYIAAYASYYEWNASIFRLVSCLGERYTHGIIFDALVKLQKDKKRIEFFSDGSPKKSSLYVGDTVAAMLLALKKTKGVEVYNIGQNRYLTIKQITDCILDEAGLPNIKRVWLGKKSNWKGDNEFVFLDTKRIRKLGWKPKVSTEEGIRRTVRYLLENKDLLKD